MSRLGKPNATEDEWLFWMIDGFEVTAHFSDDIKLFQDLTLYSNG